MTTRLPVSLLASAVVAVAGALGLIFFYAPTEALQGDVQRIFYVHVPVAQLMYLFGGVLALASLVVLAKPAVAQRWDRVAVASAELALLCCTIVLVTGPIWGRRSWGVWWVWDARLTSTLVMWAILASYLAFRALTPSGSRRARVAAVIGIVGAVDIPVIHFSVVWWRTLHPLPTVLRPGGPDLPGSMLVTLGASFLAFALLFACLMVLRIAIESDNARIDALERDAEQQSRPLTPARDG